MSWRGTEVSRRLPRPSATLVALGAIVVVVLIGNLFAVTGQVDINPITYTAGISHQLCHVSCGASAVDPNVGYITQPYGYRSAMDLLHLQLPWWNPYGGLGAPLAGEMQGASLFPLVLLFAMSSGLLWFHIVLEVIAGAATYFLARRLGLGTMVATVAGMLFALNGTFSWLGNAVLNPVCFLPMLVLGVEMIIQGAGHRRQHGWYVAALALALSLYAGFPEVAYLNALFAGAWAIVRLFKVPLGDRVRALRRLATGAVVGVGLALLVLVPFADYLKVAYIGGHASSDEYQQLSIRSVDMFFSPYIYGTIHSNLASYPFWGGIGGYYGAALVALALCGLFGSKYRHLRIFLGAWTVLGILGATNFLDVRHVWNLIPLVGTSAFGRYIMSSTELAVVLLAAFALSDLVGRAQVRRRLVAAVALTTVVTIVIALSASAINNGVVMTKTSSVIHAGLAALPFVGLGLLLLAAFAPARWRAVAVAIVIVGEAVVFFLVPTATAPKVIHLDQTPITYLQQHVGTQYRYLSLAVLGPNWGTEYGIPSLSFIDLPFPKNFASFIQEDLYPGRTPENQFITVGGMTGIVAQEQELFLHFRAYEDAGVKYLLTSVKVPMAANLLAKGVTEVYSDSIAAIYEMPDPRPLFSAASPTCTVSSSSFTTATVDCPAASTLLRTELSMKGWHAKVNGATVPITTVDGVYQRIDVPAGRSTVTFSFTPPHELLAAVLGLLALLFLAAALVDERWALWRWGRGARGRPRHAA